MLGERSGKRFRLGDKVRVCVISVDLETTRIDFSLVEAGATRAPAPKKVRRK